MTSGRLPGDFWPRCAGWSAPGAASEESEIEDLEESDQYSQAADLITPMKRPSSNQKPKVKPFTKRKPMMKRPASAVAMEKAEGGNPSSSSKPSKPYKKPCAIAKITNAKKTKKLEKPDSLDRQKGCSRCRWKSGCRSCNWRGCDKRKDHPKGTTQDDGERQHGYDDDGESEEYISQ